MNKLKKILVIAICLVMTLSLCGCAFEAQDANGNATVFGTAVEQAIILVSQALKALILVAGTWVLGKLGKRTELSNIYTALENLFSITHQTTGELQQLFVDNWKTANGGKLTDEQVTQLQEKVKELVKQKLDKPTQELIVAAGADIDALITGEAESWINALRS